MIGPIDLIFAFFLDLAIGDPRWLPHPVRVFGAAIARGEIFLRNHARQHEEKMAGILLVIIVVSSAYILTHLIQKALLLASANLLMIISMILLIYLISTTIALRELIRSSRLVIEAVRDRGLDAARKKLAMIVGRDTENLSEEGVLRATIETLAENLSDGVIAPLFYLVIGGLPLAMAYKAVNTLDSMIGYKNARYLHFGWLAARLDDIANYLPARISGYLIIIAFFLYALVKRPADLLQRARQSFRIMLRDGRNHSSPNSGVPEAAMAGGLGVRLGGLSVYGGQTVEKPFIGDPSSGEYLPASELAISIVKISSVCGLLLSIILLSIKVCL